jgi:hypothetical protein
MPFFGVRVVLVKNRTGSSASRKRVYHTGQHAVADINHTGKIEQYTVDHHPSMPTRD